MSEGFSAACEEAGAGAGADVCVDAGVIPAASSGVSGVSAGVGISAGADAESEVAPESDSNPEPDWAKKSSKLN